MGSFHTTGGYLTQVATTYYNIFDIKPDTDVRWAAADIGWITGHSYIVYGPLVNGVTQVCAKKCKSVVHGEELSQPDGGRGPLDWGGWG